MFDLNAVRADFPILTRTVHSHPLVYLDNGATSQKPQVVIDAITEYYQHHVANVKRGAHTLSDESTQIYEDSRACVSEFFGADPEELIFVRNTTEAINGVAYGWGVDQLQADQTVVTTLMEHHSNLVTWQQLTDRVGAKLRYWQTDQQGRLDLADLEELLTQHQVALVALTHVSNTLGVVNPLAEIVKLVRKLSPKTLILVDAAQSAPHLALDFHQLDVDFLVFSGHKMLGPMGIGGLLVKKQLLERELLRPWLFGGGMIDQVGLTDTTFAMDLIDRFSPGTPDVASAAGLAAACKYLQALSMAQVEQHDRDLVGYALSQLQAVPEIELIGPTEVQPGQKQLDRLGSVAFLYTGVHPHDVSQVLDSVGVAVRSGHHCTQPLHTHFGWVGTTRASFQVYNTKDEIDQLVQGLAKVKQVFGV